MVGNLHVGSTSSVMTLHVFLSRYNVELSPFPNSNGWAHPKIAFGQLQLRPLIGKYVNKNNNIDNFLYCWREVSFSCFVKG